LYAQIAYKNISVQRTSMQPSPNEMQLISTLNWLICRSSEVQIPLSVVQYFVVAFSPFFIKSFEFSSFHESIQFESDYLYQSEARKLWTSLKDIQIPNCPFFSKVLTQETHSISISRNQKFTYLDAAVFQVN